jgi:hypothetical protein
MTKSHAHRIPTEQELAGALAYCAREFRPRTDDEGHAVIRSEDLAEGLAFSYPDHGTFGPEYLRAARDTLSMHDVDHWLHLAARADWLRSDEGMQPLYAHESSR